MNSQAGSRLSAKHAGNVGIRGVTTFCQRAMGVVPMVYPKTIDRATRLIWVAHNLERAADRATHICERVVFMVTGKMEEIGASKY